MRPKSVILGDMTLDKLIGFSFMVVTTTQLNASRNAPYNFSVRGQSIRKERWIPLERLYSFSDFWHQGSFLWFQKTDEAGFLKKKFFWPKMAKKV